MRKCSDYRFEARRSLHENWTPVVVTTLVYVALALLTTLFSYCFKTGDPVHDLKTSVFMAPPELVYAIFLTGPIVFGYINAMLDFVRGNKENTVGNMFNIAFSWKYWRVVGTKLLVAIYTFLWSWLLIVPGIIKTYAYSMTFYISRDCPDIPIDDCIYLSRKMMNGNKMKLFLLDLSFIGWVLLCILSCGIGFLWLEPYKQAARSHFYEDLKAECWGENDAIDVLMNYHKS